MSDPICGQCRYIGLAVNLWDDKEPERIPFCWREAGYRRGRAGKVGIEAKLITLAGSACGEFEPRKDDVEV